MGRDAAIKGFRRLAKKRTEDKIRELAGDAGIDARDILTAEYSAWLQALGRFNQALEAYHLAWLASKDQPGVFSNCRERLNLGLDDLDKFNTTFRAALSNFMAVAR